MDDQSPDQSMKLLAAKLQGDLSGLTQILIHGLGRQLSACEIDTVEYTVLSTCFARGPIAIRDIRELLPIDYGHLSRTITRLHYRDLLQKVRLRNDQRVVTLKMTEEGVALMPELTRIAQEYYALLVRDIDLKELAGCVAIMERMIGGPAGDAGGENHAAPGAASSQSRSEGSEDGPGISSPAQDQSLESPIARLQMNDDPGEHHVQRD